MTRCWPSGGRPARGRGTRRCHHGVIMGYLMYPSGLVPRRMAMLGLIGGPLLIPEAPWEASLGIYCAWKGFRPRTLAEPEAASV
jgi:hypothetical protein